MRLAIVLKKLKKQRANLKKREHKASAKSEERRGIQYQRRQLDADLAEVNAMISKYGKDAVVQGEH